MTTYRYEQHIGANLRRLRERDHPDWSLNKVAQMLTARGQTMDATAVKRIEEGRRRIKFDEAVAIRDILGVDMDELTTSPELLQRRFLLDLLKDVLAADKEWRVAPEMRKLTVYHLQHIANETTGGREALERGVSEWAASNDLSDLYTAMIMHEVTQDAEWDERVRTILRAKRAARSDDE
jgi:transcriptional regulator with XRE-family HTH domain